MGLSQQEQAAQEDKLGQQVARASETAFNAKKWAELALLVQDACNLCGIAQSFAQMLIKMNEGGIVGSQQWEHECVILFVNKMESLVRSNSGVRFSDAYDWCSLVSKK